MAWSRAALASLLVGLLPGAAFGEPRDFASRISFALPGFGERVTAVGQGVASLAPDVPLTTLALDGLVVGSTVVPVTDPLVSNSGLVALRLAASFRTAELRIDPIAPPFSEPALSPGAPVLRGEVRFCLLVPDCSLGLGLPLSAGSGSQGVGVGGIVTIGSRSVRLSLLAAPFTLGTASLMGESAGGVGFTWLSSGSLHGPLSFTSTAGLTLSGVGGRLTLVAPLRIVSSPAAAGRNELPGFTRVEIQLLPEPAAWPPLALGTCALAVVGHRRRIRSRSSPAAESRCED